MHWFEGAGRARLEHDKAIVAEDQPNLAYVAQRDGSLALVGDFTFKLPSGSPQRIATRIEFPVGYPNHEPLAFETDRRFRHDADHHFYGNDRCCLWLDVETRWRSSDPGALRRFLDELKVFYYRQLMMEANPNLPYPGPSRGHGTLGYLEHLEERLRLRTVDLPRLIRALDGGVYRNAPCPCGRRIRYRKCHRRAIVRYRNSVAPEQHAKVIDALGKIKREEIRRRDVNKPGSVRPSPRMSVRTRTTAA
jgi:hypothetical protein